MGDRKDLIGDVSKITLTRCSVNEDMVSVSVFFSSMEIAELKEGGLMIFVPRRMEGIIRKECGQRLFLPDDFFEQMELEDVDNGRVYTYEGKLLTEERSEYPIYEAMDDMGVPRSTED